MVSRLLRQCELAKCALSGREEAVVRIPDKRGELSGPAPDAVVTRQEFQSWTRHILARLDMPMRRALGDANLSPAEIDEVILVGGATRMPAVVQRLVKIFGRPPQQRLNPDEVVALGAAIQAGLIGRDQALDDLVVTDVAPFTLGTNVCKEFGIEHRPGYFLPIIHRNTTIPVSRTKRLFTVSPNQTQIEVEVYQGENRRVENNLLLGKFTVDGIPRGPAGQAVDIRFTYDLNGILEVEATIVKTEKKVTHLITQHVRGMSDQEIARAVRQMQALKTHPREEAANRLLLARAERLYKELGLGEQQVLGRLLDGFEDALELGNKETIEEYRRALGEFLNFHDFEPDGGPQEENR